MQLKKHDLNHLINALSPSERKSLSLFFNTLPKWKTTNYSLLFEQLQKKKDFHELQRLDTVQAQAKVKRRLYDNILKGLRNHHDKKSVDVLIQNILCEIEILYDLGLPVQASCMFYKAYKLADKYEKHGLLLQIFEWERKLNIVLDVPTRDNVEIENEEQKVLGKLNETLIFKNTFSKVRAIKRQYGYIKNLPAPFTQVKNLITSLPVIGKSASQKTYYYYYFIHTLYRWMTFNHQEAYTYSSRLLSEKMEKILPNEFLDGILEHVTSCICLAKFEEALSTMDMADRFIMKQKYDQSNNFLLRAFYFKITYKTMVYYYMGKMEELAAAVRETEQKLLDFDEQFTAEMKHVINSNLKVAYMVLGQTQKAEKIIRETLNIGPRVVRKDLYDDVVFFNLFLLLHTASYALLPSAALSAHRYYKRFNLNANDRENVHYEISGLLIKEYDYTAAATRNSVLKKIKKILNQSVSADQVKFKESYTYYMIWIDSMLNASPFHEEAEKWYLDKQAKLPDI